MPDDELVDYEANYRCLGLAVPPPLHDELARRGWQLASQLMIDEDFE
jgi:hypothetical protein